MSHIVTIATKVHDHNAINNACRNLGLLKPREGTAKLYIGEASGLLVQFPDWRYPVVIDVLTGNMQYDNFEENWKA
jgi:hypothetical protein